MASSQGLKFIAFMILIVLPATALNGNLVAGAQEVTKNSSHLISIAENQSKEDLNRSINQTSGRQNEQSPMRRHIDAPTLNHYGLMAYQRGYANYSVKYFNESINQSANFILPLQPRRPQPSGWG